MASFTFDDGTGSQTLQSSWPAPANRFRDWIPIPTYIGERAIALGDRRRYQYILATSQAASGRLPGIAIRDEHILRAFKLWAEAGGTFTVTTGDAEANIYADCQLASDRDGNPIDLDIQFDPVRGVYTVGFTIEHVGSPQEVLRAVYLSQSSLVLSATAGSYNISGSDAYLLTGAMILNATGGSYTITGADASLTIA